MENASTASVFWVNILEREGWLVVNVDDRNICIVVTIAENGSEFIKVAGFHLGETRFVGEKNNIFSIKVEQIAPSQRAEMLPKIHEALPIQIHDLPITFL